MTPIGYKRVPRPCPHHVPCADPNGCSGYELVPDPDYVPDPLTTPITITLRFRRPMEVATLLEIVKYAVDDAKGCYEDEGDPADGQTLVEYEELYQALLACFFEQGFTIQYDPEAKDNKLFYNGQEIIYVRESTVVPVLKED